MNISQCVQLACLGIAGTEEIREQRWVTVGEMLLAHPGICGEIRAWYYRGTLDDLQSPEMREEVRKRGRTPEEIADGAARTFLHRVLFPVTLTELMEHVRDGLGDREVVAVPYPFTFGSPVDPRKAQEAARLTDELLELGRQIRLPWED